jgi:hypothetical protein
MHSWVVCTCTLTLLGAGERGRVAAVTEWTKREEGGPEATEGTDQPQKACKEGPQDSGQKGELAEQSPKASVARPGDRRKLSASVCCFSRAGWAQAHSR